VTEASERLARLVRELGLVADADRAAGMRAYMRDVAPFFGVAAPARRSVQREVFAGWVPGEPDLVAFARAAWQVDQREVQYAACDLLARHVSRLSSASLPAIEQLIVTKAWWDTVDSLAPVVGAVVAADPSLVAVMDRWIESDDFWLARVAILHQLRYGHDTDEARLFGYCLRRASDAEFFVRKAIGWALRQYARVAPDAVRTFVDAHDDVLSPLSQREARKHL
jgi:3-methyladenine DNA glycosylase AlkD